MSITHAPLKLVYGYAHAGAMQKLTKQPMRQCEETARANVAVNLHTRSHLLFVYDVISLVGKPGQLKFVMDAARYPLTDLDDDEFEIVYGLPKRLSFKMAEARPCIKQDWWSALY
jgi:hypothetical protein